MGKLGAVVYGAVGYGVSVLTSPRAPAQVSQTKAMSLNVAPGSAITTSPPSSARGA